MDIEEIEKLMEATPLPTPAFVEGTPWDELLGARVSGNNVRRVGLENFVNAVLYPMWTTGRTAAEAEKYRENLHRFAEEAGKEKTPAFTRFDGYDVEYCGLRRPEKEMREDMRTRYDGTPESEHQIRLEFSEHLWVYSGLKQLRADGVI